MMSPSEPLETQPTEENAAKALANLELERVKMELALKATAADTRQCSADSSPRQGDETEWEELTPDGGVAKQVVTEGTGDLPQPHAICLVHYKGKLKETGSQFADTEDEKGDAVEIVAGRDCVTREAGLNIAVQHMRIGETSRLRIAPQYGYGAKGNFSFPSVPPHAHLEYTMRLLDCLPPSDKLKKDMFFEERLEAGQRRRQQANALFAAGKPEEALAEYTTALTYVDEEFLFQLEGFFLDKGHAVAAPIQLNMAACYLQLEQWVAAAAAASAALKMFDESKVALRSKAFFRRAKARRAQQQTAEAVEDLTAALALSPGDASLVRELSSLRGQVKGQQKAVDELFKNKLKSKLPPPQPSPRGADAAETSVARGVAPGHIPPSVVERTFFWIADCLSELLRPLWQLLGWRPHAMAMGTVTAAKTE